MYFTCVFMVSAEFYGFRLSLVGTLCRLLEGGLTALKALSRRPYPAYVGGTGRGVYKLYGAHRKR